MPFEIARQEPVCSERAILICQITSSWKTLKEIGVAQRDLKGPIDDYVSEPSKIGPCLSDQAELRSVGQKALDQDVSATLGDIPTLALERVFAAHRR